MINIKESFHPLRELILIRRERPDQSKGGIIIPEAVQTYGWRGDIVRTGDDVKEFSVGDTILFKKEHTVLPFDDRTLAITDAKCILGKIVCESSIERIYPCGNFLMAKIAKEDKNNIIEIVGNSDTGKSICGTVYKIGVSVKSISCGNLIWFDARLAVTCVENDLEYIIIKEDDVLCMSEK
jgi:co-chaperonin GroES (HSP10)